MGSSRSRKTDDAGSLSVAAPTPPTENAAGAGRASPLADAPADRHSLTKSERMLLARLKTEVMELRFKARRFDEINPQLPAWRAKAQRYDQLVSQRSTLKKTLAFALLLLGHRALPIISWALARKGSNAPTASPPASLAARAKADGAAPRAAAPGSPDSIVESERVLLERLKREVAAFRYKVRRFDGVKDELPGWRAKAERYDKLASELTIVKRSVALALLFRGHKALPNIGRASQRKRSESPTASPPAPVVAGAKAAEAGPPASDPRYGARRAASAGKGRVCILSRKDLRDITRVPRMAKALIDAGYAVTVISLRAPVQQLIDMCPETRYIAVTPRPITGRILGRINYLRDKNRQKRQRRAETLRNMVGGARLRVWVLRAGRALLSALYRLAELPRRLLILAPCTLLFKRNDQKFMAAWRNAAHHDTLAALSPFLGQLQQWAMTHAFAHEADKATRGLHFDIVQAHDNYALVAAARLAARDKAKLIYDAVELSSHRLATNPSRFEMLREWCERREEAAIFRKSDVMITVGEGLANWYARNYAIARPLVIRNCRYYWPYAPDPRLRTDAGIGTEQRLIIWFGSAYPQQGIELLLDAVPLMPPNIHLAVVATALPRWATYVNDELPRRAAALGIAGRVHFLTPREPNDLVPYVSGADLGVIPRPSEHPNNFFSMPNKFLEMVMARLPIAVSRVGDMSDVIRKYGIGDIFDERDPTDIAAVIDAMLEPANHQRLKKNVGNAAEDMTWEAESTVYLAAIRSMMPLTKTVLAAGGGLAPIEPLPA
jgi:glycosyltransferase involved in cell wall biosynthesis